MKGDFFFLHLVDLALKQGDSRYGQCSAEGVLLSAHLYGVCMQDEAGVLTPHVNGWHRPCRDVDQPWFWFHSPPLPLWCRRVLKPGGLRSIVLYSDYVKQLRSPCQYLVHPRLIPMAHKQINAQVLYIVIHIQTNTHTPPPHISPLRQPVV